MPLILFWILSGMNLSVATSFFPQPFAETVREAPVIVRAKVDHSRAEWALNADGGKQIFTFTELQVREVVKGEVNEKTISVREVGGEKDGVSVSVSGVAEFIPGEEIVLYLSPPDRAGGPVIYPVYGMMMGKLNVVTDESGHETLRGPALAGDATERKIWTLSALRELVHEQGKSPKPTGGISNSPPAVGSSSKLLVGSPVPAHSDSTLGGAAKPSSQGWNRRRSLAFLSFVLLLGGACIAYRRL